MNFYEIQHPYYALIKAKDEADATHKYMEVIAGVEEDMEAIRKRLKCVNKYYAVGKIALTLDFDTGEHLTTKELEAIIESTLTEILMVDSSLL